MKPEHGRAGQNRAARKPARTENSATPASARAVALMVLGDVRQGRTLDDSLAARLGRSGLDARDRAFARTLTATTLRRLGQIDAAIATFVSKPLPETAAVARDILRLGAAQLIFLDMPPHAAVNETVALTTATPRHRGLVNAVLRRLAAEGKAIVARQDAERLATPDWLWRSWCKAYGEAETRRIVAAHLTEPPLDLTAPDAATWADRLGAVLLPTGTLRRPGGGLVSDLPGFAEGAWWVQDAAAALPARLFGEVRGRHVADLCAAPGGKTAQLAAAGAHVTAVEKSPLRLARLRENLARLGLAADLVEADATEWRPQCPVDAVLLDAPCSATGTIRRHPDLPWRKRAADQAAIAALQDRLLANAAAMTAPGGTLVYAVCSLEPAEGPARIARFLKRAPDFACVPIAAEEIGGAAEFIGPDGTLRTLPSHWPERGGLDGFYVARLRRNPAAG